MRQPILLLPIKLSEFEIRIARPEELPEVYEMGFDEWGEGKTLTQHIQACHESIKYPHGIRYVLVNHNKQLVASLMCYEYQLNSNEKIIGIGTVCTKITERKKGYAGLLLNGVTETYIAQKIYSSYVLFSDINPAYYEKFGFIPLPSELQKYPKSVFMIKCQAEFYSKLVDNLAQTEIAYF
ncbi:GNAT family N-acetyltransferase [Pigmentibacter sp. JX0631]|uniref:GNAT family N-acetyltransferase n=1 Tax=Pigmentibacter sp. JX0631 TaxID=2976982 RepID=UPI0024697075|nr:GNAT family N-acetyltransferase [Pigmentibacter sp. JX0631]WGL60665.1 GNAT family N-acetyltransferase [Pigmentibacter sp. JX0631]